MRRGCLFASWGIVDHGRLMMTKNYLCTAFKYNFSLPYIPVF